MAFIKTTHQTLSIGEASTNGQKKIVKEPDVKDRGDTFAVPADEADQFFLGTLLYTDQHTEKTAPPPVACLPFQPLPFQRSAEDRFPKRVRT